METAKRGISIYVTPELYAQIEAAAREEDRSLSKYLERVVSNYMTHPRPAVLEVRSKRDDGQMHLEDAIAAAVKRGPVRSAKHK
jgi:vacuolar-type H+-ATPase subunit F/Vma7